MISARHFLDSCLEQDFTFYIGTPCSYLKPIINYVIDNKEFSFINAANEGDAIALASGVAMAGRKSVVMFQNSGLGNAVNPLTSLNYTFRIPLVLIVTLRGEPGGPKDEPQHELMGEITIAMLETMRIGWSYFPDSSDKIAAALKHADTFMAKEGLPFAFIMRKGDIEPYKLNSSNENRVINYSVFHEGNFSILYDKRPTRNDALKIIQSISGKGTAVVASTGFSGRELCMLDDRDNQLYMVGSMGCALSIGTGIALHKPGLKMIVIDGDGALLMRTGSMATTCMCAPSNLIHILLDNEIHESTGGQKTLSGNVSFPVIAKGFRYAHVFSTDTLDEFNNCLIQSMSLDGPVFIHLKTRQGIPADLGRPSVKPVQVKQRFMDYLNNFQ
jgi:phosphonopyruvate decarboxylase